MELPEYVQIEPVGQCNLRCRMCAIQFRKDGSPHGPPAFMDYALFTRLVDDMKRMTALHLQGLGEPFLHPRFFDMVAYAAAKRVRVTTNSNLTLLGTRRASRCVESGLAELHVSLDGSTPSTYEAIRVRARYRRVVAHLEQLVAARRADGSTLPRLVIVFVVMRRNLHELPELVRQAAGWGAEAVFAQRLCHDFGEHSLPAEYAPLRDFVSRETLSGLERSLIEPVFEEARGEAGRLGIELRLPRLAARETRGCDWPRRGAYLSYQGLAMPCCMIGTPDRLNFGNAAVHGIEAIWNGEAYERFRARLDSPDPPAICRSCSVYHGTF